MNEIRAELLITDFECLPSEITKILDLDPVSTWCRGDLISRTGRGTARYQENGWKWQPTCDRNNEIQDFSELFDEFIAKIGPIQEKFRMLPKGSCVQLSCCAYIKKEPPAFLLDSAMLKILAAINASVDFDIYCFDQED